MTLLLQIVMQQDLYLVNKFRLGLDYYEFYRASHLLLRGESPYLIQRYVTSPIPALLNIPATMWPFLQVRYVVSGLVFFSVLLSYFLIHRSVNVTDKQSDGWCMLAGLVVICFSYPFLFLFDRGNIDGFALLFTCTGIYLQGRREALAGICFALAISLKVYPVLVVIPILAARRFRLLYVMVITLFILFLMAPLYWFQFLTDRLMVRGAEWRIDENGSMACSFFYIGLFLDKITGSLLGTEGFPLATLLPQAAIPVYLLLLLAMGVLDLKQPHGDDPRELNNRISLYFPFMVAVPSLAYHYELVWLMALMPTVSFFWRNASERTVRTVLLAMSVGIAASQFQAVAFEKLVGSVYPHCVPGFGSLIVLLSVVALRLASRPKVIDGGSASLTGQVSLRAAQADAVTGEADGVQSSLVPEQGRAG